MLPEWARICPEHMKVSFCIQNQISSQYLIAVSRLILAVGPVGVGSKSTDELQHRLSLARGRMIRLTDFVSFTLPESCVARVLRGGALSWLKSAIFYFGAPRRRLRMFLGANCTLMLVVLTSSKLKKLLLLTTCLQKISSITRTLLALVSICRYIHGSTNIWSFIGMLFPILFSLPEISTVLFLLDMHIFKYSILTVFLASATDATSRSSSERKIFSSASKSGSSGAVYCATFWLIFSAFAYWFTFH